ncbi:MAG TPA: hypothetical protein VGI07_04175 [Solirubrobacteraceae bacterium]
MGLEAVAELVRRAARDTAVVRALSDTPEELATVVDLSSEELQALRATTSRTDATDRSFLPPQPPADSGTGLLPPQGSGVPAATPVTGITSLPTPPPPPVTPPPPPVIPPPPPVTPPAVTPAPVTPPPVTPQPPVTPPPPPGGPGVALQTAPCRCGCAQTAGLATAAIVANTAITAITAIAAMPCGRPRDDRPTTVQPSQGGT